MVNESGKSPPHAVVIGLDDVTGLQTARIFKERGVPVIGYAKNIGHYCCKTNVCERILATNTDTEELIVALKELGPQLPQKAVLVPCTDTSVIAISNQRESLSDWYHIALPSAKVVDTLIDKVKFYQYALENDLPIPATRFVSSVEEIEYLLDEYIFPCIVKPPYRTESWKANLKQKAYIVRDSNELLNQARCLFDYVDMLIVQQIIEGPDQNHVTGNCYYNIENQPLVVYTSRKIRQWPPGVGQGCSSESIKDESVAKNMLRLFSGIGYYGLGYLEMKRDSKTGQYFMIEPNIGRPTGRSAEAEGSGVELLFTMYCDILSWPLPENREQKPNGAKWFFLQKDFQSGVSSFFKGQLRLGTWVRSFRGRKVYALFSAIDPKPFIFSMLHMVLRIIGSIFGKN